jgi:nucleoside-diphosphate-sugar epimerase
MSFDYSSLKGKKCIVTGGAGFIGAHICEGLLDHGAFVYCMDDFSAGHYSNVKEFDGLPGFTIVPKSICDKMEIWTLSFPSHILFLITQRRKKIFA